MILYLLYNEEHEKAVCVEKELEFEIFGREKNSTCKTDIQNGST